MGAQTKFAALFIGLVVMLGTSARADESPPTASQPTQVFVEALQAPKDMSLQELIGDASDQQDRKRQLRRDIEDQKRQALDKKKAWDDAVPRLERIQALYDCHVA